ncbi:MAG: DNA-binding protein [Magnetococcales bacterium]|nr:DNA-binding protein [Magnetococcales bacterium]
MTMDLVALIVRLHHVEGIPAEMLRVLEEEVRTLRRVCGIPDEPKESTPAKRGWMRRPAAAQYLGCSESTLEKLALTGNGPPYSTFGRSVHYHPDNLDIWMAARERQSTSEPRARIPPQAA